MTARITVSDERRANLARLADYLASRCPPRGFSMMAYCDDWLGAVSPLASVSSTRRMVACAVGHAPRAGISVPSGCSHWGEYCRAALSGGAHQVETGLFDAGWSYTDDTPQGAARRIRRFLDVGELRDVDGRLIQAPLADDSLSLLEHTR